MGTTDDADDRGEWFSPATRKAAAPQGLAPEPKTGPHPISGDMAAAFEQGRKLGFEQGYDHGFADGKTSGRAAGRSQGRDEALAELLGLFRDRFQDLEPVKHTVALVRDRLKKLQP